MLLGVFILTFSVAFAISVPVAERNDSSSTEHVSDWEHGYSLGESETGIKFNKAKSENLSEIFYQTPGNKFYVSKLAKTWEDADKCCESVGMTLASITSQKEQLELFKFLFRNDLVPVDDYSGYWLSGQQLANGLYKWLALNKHINCWGWLPGEPSHIDDLEHCVELKFEAHKVRLGWNNLSCEKDRPFICQKINVFNKDTAVNQPEEQFQETNEEQQTSCYWFYSPIVPTIRRGESEGYIRLG